MISLIKKVSLTLLLTSVILAKRIIVLDPAATEIIYALGAEENIVAISHLERSGIWPEEKTKLLPSVGSYVKPNMEKVVELKPDLVIVSHHSLGVKEDLAKFNIEVWNMTAKSYADMYEYIEKIAKYVDKVEEAKKIVAEMKEGIEKIDKSKVKGKSALFVFSENPMMLFCKDTLASDTLNQLGMINLCTADIQTPIINAEEILSKDPDYIFHSSRDKNFVDKNPLLKNTKAYKNGKVIETSQSKIMRSSPQIVQALQDLSQKF